MDICIGDMFYRIDFVYTKYDRYFIWRLVVGKER